MARNKGFSLDYEGFLDFAEQLDELGGSDALLNATIEALDKSKEYVNNAISEAMNASEYEFTKGSGYSRGEARESLKQISQVPVMVEGTVVKAYTGVDLADTPEVIILAVVGAPDRAKDTKLANAVRVKGKIRKEVDKIQEQVFNEALKEALNG